MPLYFIVTLAKHGENMHSISSTHVRELSHAILFELEDKDARKLKFAGCPSCKKINFYRLASLKDSPLICKSCNTPIPIERHLKSQEKTTEEGFVDEADV